MRINPVKTFLFLLFSVFIMPAAFTAAKQPDTEILRGAIEASVKAEGVRLDDYTLVDAEGVRFNLADYFRDGKPLVVSFIYTKCPEVCPTITSSLKGAVDGARAKFGRRFNVLSIGFDPGYDTAEGLKAYGLRFTRDFDGFRFATSDAATIERLTRQFGFFYMKKDDGSFDHIDMVSVVRADGTIYRQVYSVRTQSANIVERLDELITGRVPPDAPVTLLDKLKFFCYKYDPSTGRYVVDYAVIAGLFIQLAVITATAYAVWGRSVVRFFKGGR